MCWGAVAATGVRAQPTPTQAEPQVQTVTTAGARDLAALSIEQLMAIDVTSASKRDERLFQVPAAVFVITNEDLRRSGALSIPEALRMVPGLDVEQIDANKWEVSARGFNNRFSNKLLVLIDGRIIYTHIFSGVYWESQDVVLEDVERIEVIRGPGATLWGANAVNGVINIITKSSRDTLGGLLVAGAGNLETAFGTLRYGGSLGEGLTYRIFAKGFSRADNDLPEATAGSARDGWTSGHVGLRADWSRESESATLEGELYRVRTGERITELESLSPPVSGLRDRDSEFHGGFASLTWKHAFSQLSSATFSASYDVRMRDEVTLRPHEEILDLGLQDNFSFGQHGIVWGLGYRRTTDEIPGSFSGSVTPLRAVQSLASAFVQDDVTLVEGRLHAIAGVKVERYDRHAPEYQPNFRLLWTPYARHTFWASAARALTDPGRVQLGVRDNIAAFPSADGNLVLVSVFGNPNLRQEEVVAYEAGYRLEATERISFDLATFYNRYDRLIAPESGAPFFESSPAPAHVVYPVTIENAGSGDTHGAELAADWNASPRLRFRGAMSWIETNLRVSGTPTGSLGASLGDGAALQASLRTWLDLPHHLEANLSVSHVGNNSQGKVGPYWRVDAVGSWRPVPSVELAVGIRNLFDRRNLEVLTTSDSIQTTVTPLSAYGKMTWHF